MTGTRARALVAPPRARTVALALDGLTVVGAVAGVQGFLSGQFDPLVSRLSFVDGPAVPALALGLCVGLPQAVALTLGLRRHARAPEVGVGAGVVLTGWVLAQLPLIGWTSPVQWAFFAVGVGESVAALLWWRAAVD
ncbi:hypothetical protein HP550_07225 [Cellulomonas humilata]|uniref:MFS transporter n=1 Tax=Cellulomonas humilata TaxID=144055 RepID=A0A7Y5ZZI9_9CELL|nr:hypothetical protein [Cellulomonas humilata]NUU17038.1 hypothetical protein [Cellulomonas humilata]